MDLLPATYVTGQDSEKFVRIDPQSVKSDRSLREILQHRLFNYRMEQKRIIL